MCKIGFFMLNYMIKVQHLIKKKNLAQNMREKSRKGGKLLHEEPKKGNKFGPQGYFEGEKGERVPYRDRTFIVD